MKINLIELHNFMSYDHLRCALPSSGLLLLEGENGAGKSALLEAVAFGLWGKPIRGAPGWSPWREGEAGEVCLTAELEGGTLVVERERSENGKTALAAKLDGRDLTSHTMAETQERLNVLVGEPWEFRLAAVFSREMMDVFSAASDAARGEVIDRMQGVEGWDKAADNASEAKRDAQEAWERAQQAQVQAQESLEHATSRRDELKARLEALSDSEAEQRAVARWRDLEKSQGELTVSEARFDSQAATLSRRVEAARADVDQADAVANKWSAETVAMRRVLEEEDRKLEEIRQHINKPCPLCRRVLGEAEAFDTIQNGRRALEPRHQQLGVRSKKLEELKKSLASARQEYVRLQTEEKNLRLKAKEASADLAAVESEREDLRPLVESVAKKAARREELETSLEQAQAEVDMAEENLEGATIELDRAVLEDRVCSVVAECFGSKGVRARLRDESLAVLQHYANHYLGRLGAPYRLKLSATRLLKSGREVSGVSVVTDGAGGGVFQGCSQGEQRRGDAGLVLALPHLRPTSRAYHFRCFDEVLDVLDPKGRERMAELLTEQAQSSTVLVVTHSDELRSLFPTARVVRVQRDESGASTMEGC